MFGGDRYGTRVLSERERRVIELVAQGLKNIEVAEALGTTEFVVKNYLRVIYDKLGLWNRVELALWYEKHRHEIPGNGMMSTVFFQCDRCHLECRVDSEAPDSRRVAQAFGSVTNHMWVPHSFASFAKGWEAALKCFGPQFSSAASALRISMLARLFLLN
jgi:DNA-binding CsgD family transcriptional regulator